MKVYDVPKELPAPKFDFNNIEGYDKACSDHKEKLKTYLVTMGYTGKNTGLEYQTPMADGCACYMIADAPRQACLIHLPYWDGWHDRNVEFVPKKEIIARAKQQAGWVSIFSPA